MRTNGIKVLVACEESQTVTKAFRKRGFEAFSSDIQDCSGGHPEWHYKGDVLEIINDGWDLIIGHPPCTHLSVSGARWFTEGKKPLHLREEAVDFFMEIVNADAPYIAVENPICIMSTRYKKPTQIIQPYEFGHPEQKKTCLWLKGLPPLEETNNVHEYMMTLPKKEREKVFYMSKTKDRGKKRSVTFQGIADAMAKQWGDFLLNL